MAERRQAEPGAGVEPEQEEEPNPLGLPANASALLPGGGPPDESFSCDGRGYGYYADPANACRVFHVCLPLQLPVDPNANANANGPADAGADAQPAPPPHRFSFICPEQTLFNQEAFTCTRPEDSIPCEESPQWYHLNDKLGRTDTPSTNVEESESSGNAL
ncbi:Uncharacterized protein GBIM_13186 [Gryllus bimaculatus]|nr:Uncharacterized protein GBIM_13186 [Gryllus bimaculatus]